ncbi:unnamed protein product [Mucor circinelloides]
MSNNMMSVSASEREAFFDTLKKMKKELDDKAGAIVALLDELDEASLKICSQDIRARPEKRHNSIEQYNQNLQKVIDSLQANFTASFSLINTCCNTIAPFQDIHGVIMLNEELQTAAAALERASAESMELGKSCSAVLNELTGALVASSKL